MTKRPPIEQDPATHIYAFPEEHDPDECAAKVVEQMSHHDHTMFWLPQGYPLVPVVRVVPLADAELYAEAGALIVARLAGRPGVSGARVEGPGKVVFVAAGAEARQTFRVLEALRN